MSKAWQAYALHVLDAIAKVRCPNTHLQPVETCMKTMLAAASDLE